MTALSVAVKYLQGRFVASTLTAFSVALGVSLVIASFLLTRGIKEGFIEGTTDYSLVVGAKGSPTQLVLNVVFHMDVPTPNILYTAYEQLQNDTRVEVAVPVALGDAYRGFRYVATTTAYFAALPWRRRPSQRRHDIVARRSSLSSQPMRLFWAPKWRAGQACGLAISFTKGGDGGVSADRD